MVKTIKKPRGVYAPRPRDFTMEHLLPKSQGGTRDLDNIVGAHYTCNNMRGNVPHNKLPKDFRKRCREAIIMNIYGSGFQIMSGRPF
jgi:hypothetical protein